MFMGSFNEDIEEYTKDVKVRMEREKKAIDESDLDSIQFEIKLDKSALVIVWFLNLLVLLKGSQQFVYDIYVFVNYGKPLEFKVIDYVVISMLVASFLFAVLSPIAIRFLDVPSVRKGYIYCNKKVYHYSEITLIKISSLQIMSVYIGKKKIFSISRDYINYDSFLAWARKCGVNIFHEPAFEIYSENVPLMTAFVVLVIAVVVIGLFMLG